jgi:hypothetical protein
MRITLKKYINSLILKIYEEIAKEKSASLKRKLLYVQKLNQERTKLQEDTYEAEYLTKKREFDLQYMKLYEEIQKIVNGNIEVPNIEASDYENYKIEKSKNVNEIGIPNYWYTVLKNSNDFFIINEKDEKILQHLTEVKLIEKEDKLSFTIEYHFSPNNYFTDSVLFKSYNYNIKDQLITDVVTSPAKWKSEEVKPNKIKKIKKQKSIKFFKN